MFLQLVAFYFQKMIAVQKKYNKQLKEVWKKKLSAISAYIIYFKMSFFIEMQSIMRNLVRRYVTVEQRKSDNQGVTEDDVNEIKQDISAFRCELIEVLKNSGMNTSTATGVGQGISFGSIRGKSCILFTILALASNSYLIRLFTFHFLCVNVHGFSLIFYFVSIRIIIEN